MVCSVLWCDAFVVTALSDKSWENQGRGLVDRKLVKPPPPPPVLLLLAVPRRLFCFGSLVVLDVVFRYLSLFNVRLAGGHLCGKLLFTWLSLVVSLIASFCAVLFPTRCLG